MKTLFNSIVGQVIFAAILGVVVFVIAYIVGVGAINRLQNAQTTLDALAIQRADIFRLAELSRRLDDATTELETTAIVTQLTQGIAGFDTIQASLRTSDDDLGIAPVEDGLLLPILDDMDETWSNYRDLLNGHLQAEAETDVEALLNRTATQSVLLFTYTDRLQQGVTFATEQRQQQTQIVLTITGILTLGVLIFVGVLFYRIIANLNSLRQTAQQFSQGYYAARANISTYTELAEVNTTLNVMADSILEREKSLTELNQSLEQRVADRTVELEKARKEAEASALLANENSRLKSEFLSMMSHELRTPMNAIEGFTGIMLQRMAGVEYNDKAERYLTKVQSNSRRLLGLINDILDLSRIESGRLELAYHAMSPSAVAFEWYDNLSILANEKGLQFDVKVDPDMPEIIYGDQESLTKVAINLLGNAIKFTEEGSVSLSLDKRGEQMVMEVKDTGMGIPPHAREVVFEEFRQVDQSTTRKHGGTGLGLAITQKLIRAMNGTITLDSEVSVGSTFTVTLPIHTEAQLKGVST